MQKVVEVSVRKEIKTIEILVEILVAESDGYADHY